MRSFSDVFGHAPEVRAHAPGRVNLLGEHTDYNDGFVLPTTIPQLTRVELAKSRDDQFRFYSANLDESVAYVDGAAGPDGYARYVFGCIQVLKKRGEHIAPVELHIRSDVPMGGGLSSSAALEVAVLRALREAFRIQLDDVELAKLAQQAEIEYAGVRCGILDQMATSLGDAKHMLFLDTRTLERKLLPLPLGAELVVIDSGIARTLATSGYNERRAQCEEAARLLGVKALRDEGDPMRANALPPPLDRRARHVITENARVLRAAQGVSAQEFGELMNASHTSLRDDYEVSIEGLDRLVELLQKQPDVFGARLTGAGFGGACVALVKEGHGATVKQIVLTQYAELGYRGEALV
ncbi:MAG TPA: galactokinase [Steroidobacteraceae bacterium]|nr:galactokinase [Steroidobacteraceae bacterium]